MLPTRAVTYRGASFDELDVTAVLDRRPELALVDELAHANLPGGRHAKRWQDVGELLANGIDVATTLNVANIESLGMTVSTITGVHPAEPVPDAFLRAGEVRLVTSRLRRCGTGWPMAGDPPRAGGCGAVASTSASRISPPCGAHPALAR